MINDNKAINMLSALKKEVDLLDISSCEIGKFEAHINSIQQLLIENYGSIMPKIFDDWYKSIGNHDSNISIEYLLYVRDNDISSNADCKLYNWLSTGNQIDRFLRCIDAIRYGYEVEK